MQSPARSGWSGKPQQYVLVLTSVALDICAAATGVGIRMGVVTSATLMAGWRRSLSLTKRNVLQRHPVIYMSIVVR